MIHLRRPIDEVFLQLYNSVSDTNKGNANIIRHTQTHRTDQWNTSHSRHKNTQIQSNDYTLQEHAQLQQKTQFQSSVNIYDYTTLLY